MNNTVLYGWMPTLVPVAPHGGKRMLGWSRWERVDLSFLFCARIPTPHWNLN